MAARPAAHGRDMEHLSAARRMLSSLPDLESDSDGGSFNPLSDSGDDDPDLAGEGLAHGSAPAAQGKAPSRPPGPGHRDGAARQPGKSSRAGQVLSLNQPGSGPISPALHQASGEHRGSRHKGRSRRKDEIEPRVPSRSQSQAASVLDDDSTGRSSRQVHSRNEGADGLSHVLAAARIHESPDDANSRRGSMSSPDGNRSSGGERNSTNMRMAKWKQEAIQEGMRLVEQERQQSEEMHQLLRKRIEFLTEELEMTRSELNVKAQECDELMEVAEELDKELARDRPSDESDSEEVHDQTKAQTWLEKLQENLQLSASKHSKEDSAAGPARVCAVPTMWKLDMGLEMPAWLQSFSPQKTVQTLNKDATPKKDARPQIGRTSGERKKTRAESPSKKRFQLC